MNFCRVCCNNLYMIVPIRLRPHNCVQTYLCPYTIMLTFDCGDSRLCPFSIVLAFDCSYTGLRPFTIVLTYISLVPTLCIYVRACIASPASSCKCWCRERVCHACVVKGCHISLRFEL